MLEPSTQGGWRQASEWLSGRRVEMRALAVVLCLAVLVPLILWSRTPPAVIAPPSVAVAQSPAVLTSPAPTGGLQIYVHVAGAVRRPGLYGLPSGSRVVDAIEAAGGPTPRGDLDALNLAALLVDATKVEVPKRGETVVSAQPSTGSSPSAPGLVDLNTADQTLLETIPGVGPVTATSILQYRSEVGAFESVDELLEVDGIGPATLESLRSYVTV